MSSRDINVGGFWAPQWQPVVDTFTENFIQAGEEGAGMALYHRGEMVLDIWAGVRRNKLAGIESEPWAQDTCVNIFSAGKGLVALCVLQLVASNQLDLDAPVSRYWPEFAQAGKADIRVNQLLCHRSGLSAFHPHIANQHIFDWQAMVTAVATDSPWWTPNQGQGYSPFIYGWALGELIIRVSGYPSVNDYFQAHIAKPLGINSHFGVPDTRLAAVADTGPIKRQLGALTTSSGASSSGADSIALGKLMKADPRGVTNRAFSNPITLMTATNTREWRQAQIPAANAHTDARSLAKVYGVLANGGGDLLDSTHLSLCWQEQTFEQDRVLGLPLRFSHGFMLSQADRPDCRYGRGSRAFGHPGAGGSVGFADPDYGVGFGYVTQRMGQSLLIDERAVRLIDAVYQILGETP